MRVVIKFGRYGTQILAILPIWLMMMCGGMFTSYGVFNNFLGYQFWSAGASSPDLFFAAASFHFALAIGATVASSFYYKFETRKIHIFNTLLTLVASITLSIFPNNFITIVVSRTLFGLGFGSIYIISIIYASEISSAKFRAKAIFTLHLSLTLGMLLLSVLVLSMAQNFDLILRTSAIISALCSIVSAALGYFTMKSSHIFMMKNNNSANAMQRFQYFNRDSADSNSSNNVEVESMQTHIIEERKRRFNFASSHNVTGLITVMLVKLAHLSIFNALHNSYRTLFLSVFLTIDDINYTEVTMLVARLIGCISGWLLLDQISKRWQFFISTLAISLLLFAFGTLLTTSMDQLNLIWIPATLLIPLEYFLGFGVSQLDDVLNGEVYPFKEKAISIATTIVLEQCVHIVLIIIYYTWIFSLGSIPNSLTFIFGAITLLCGLVLLHPALLRDSRRQTLVQMITKEETRKFEIGKGEEFCSRIC